MALIEWTDDLSVRVTRIDEQHRELVKLINDLHEAMKARRAQAELGLAISRLVEYTEFHFVTEERIMAEHLYPNSSAHRAEHRAFVAKTKEFETGFAAGKLLLSMEVMTFLKEWLTHHICKIDKAFGTFLNSKGVS